MTKEELIALSDLNREDNIKYISSEAQGIAIAKERIFVVDERAKSVLQNLKKKMQNYIVQRL